MSMTLTPDTNDDDAHEINGATAGRPVPQRTKFVVGLDYGTTYSSVSYVKFDVATPPNTIVGNQIESINYWPGCIDRWRNPEVSSESWYHGKEFHWGYNARQPIKGLEDGGLDDRNRIIQFAKLLLCERQTDDGPRDDLRETMKRLEKTGKDLIKDYIREILKHSKTHLEEKENFREDCEVELVLCVPAGWPAKALRTMQEILLEVTQEIKFGVLAPLFILNEPEAAAAYMLEALPGRRALNVSACAPCSNPLEVYMD
jgi:molecular chaperone DnaK (HSP70)